MADGADLPAPRFAARHSRGTPIGYQPSSRAVRTIAKKFSGRTAEVIVFADDSTWPPPGDTD